MTDVRYVTHSELRLFKDCRRAWWFGQFRGLRPIQPELAGPAPLGDRVHRAVRVHYDPTTDETAAAAVRRLGDEAVQRAVSLQYEKDAVEEVRKDAELATIMVDGYLEWLEETGADAGLEVIAPEERVEVPFFTAPDGTEYRLLAKLDLRVRRLEDGARLFLDHKTVGNLKDLPKQAYQSEQMLHYALVLRLHDPANWATGAIFNMLRKVKRTRAANPPFYGRHPVEFNDTYLRSYWDRTFHTVQDIARLDERLRNDPAYVTASAAANLAYPTPTRDCDWKCDFYQVCAMYDDGSDPENLVPRLYEVADPLARYDEED